MYLLLIVLGDVILLARRCTKSKYNYSIGKCTEDKGLVQEFASSLSIQEDKFKQKTAKERLCLCNTNTCNDVSFKKFKNKLINTVGHVSETIKNNLDAEGASATSTDSSDGVTDFVYIDDVTDYWMNYTGYLGATVQRTDVSGATLEHTHVSDRIQVQLSDVSTVDNPTTRGLAAEQDNNLQLVLISVAVHYFKF